MELLFRVEDRDGRPHDVVCQIDPETTVGELVEYLSSSRNGEEALSTVRRNSRGRDLLDPNERIWSSDLRSGDRIQLVAESGPAAGTSHEPRARMIVVAGPDEGRSFDLIAGTNLIGRANKCDIALNDPMISRQQAALLVTEQLLLTDRGATNASEVNGIPVNGSQGLRPGDLVQFGNTVVRFEFTDAQASYDSVHNRVAFNRPPRIYKAFEGINRELPAPPQRPGKQRLPMITAAAPLVLGIVLFLITGSLTTIIFIALSPIMILGSWFEGRRSGRHEYAERVADHKAHVYELLVEIAESNDAEVERLYFDSPGPHELETMVRSLDPRLWE